MSYNRKKQDNEHNKNKRNKHSSKNHVKYINDDETWIEYCKNPKRDDRDRRY